MLRTSIVLFLIALVAALFGFEVIASGFAAMAKIAFWIFLILFALSLIAGLVRRPA